MSFRLWYPQLDVYDGVRRVACLLNHLGKRPVGLERLFILDFFFANPPLLHSTHMPQAVRREFTKVNVPRPDQTFLEYPSAPVLFQKMEPIRRQALLACPRFRRHRVRCHAGAGGWLWRDGVLPSVVVGKRTPTCSPQQGAEHPNRRANAAGSPPGSIEVGLRRED